MHARNPDTRTVCNPVNLDNGDLIEALFRSGELSPLELELIDRLQRAVEELDRMECELRKGTPQPQRAQCNVIDMKTRKPRP